MREEMQSMNVELKTFNAELQSKVEDLSRARDGMKNLIDSTVIATVFLERQLPQEIENPPSQTTLLNE